MDSVLNFLSANRDQLTEEDATGDAGAQMESVTTKVQAQVKSWIETDVWEPIRKYVIIITGCIIAVIVLTIAIKCLARTKPWKRWMKTKVKEKEAPQIYIMRKDRTKSATSPKIASTSWSTSDVAESLL